MDCLESTGVGGCGSVGQVLFEGVVVRISYLKLKESYCFAKRNREETKKQGKLLVSFLKRLF